MLKENKEINLLDKRVVEENIDWVLGVCYERK